MTPVLIDTHILLWYAKGDNRFNPALRALIRDSATLPYVSKASLWEIIIKTSLQRLDLGVSFNEFMDELPKQGFRLLDIDVQDLQTLYTLPLHHSDPFDRLIIAQAITRSWPIISDDNKFDLYPIELLQ